MPRRPSETRLGMRSETPSETLSEKPREARLERLETLEAARPRRTGALHVRVSGEWGPQEPRSGARLPCAAPQAGAGAADACRVGAGGS